MFLLQDGHDEVLQQKPDHLWDICDLEFKFKLEDRKWPQILHAGGAGNEWVKHVVFFHPIK